MMCSTNDVLVCDGQGCIRINLSIAVACFGVLCGNSVTSLGRHRLIKTESSASVWAKIRCDDTNSSGGCFKRSQKTKKNRRESAAQARQSSASLRSRTDRSQIVHTGRGKKNKMQG